MARGIITKKPAGTTTAGRIIVTNPESLGGISDGGTGDTGTGTGDAVGADPVSLEYGQGIDFTEATLSNVGDIVDFIFDGQLGSGLSGGAGSATVITGTYQPNITVGAGETVLLQAATLNGVLITNNGGTVIACDNTIIKGRITSAIAGSSVIITTGTSMTGDVSISGASILSVKGSATAGAIQSDGNTYASVIDCNIKGKLEVINATVCKCSGNVVSGGTNTPGCTA